MVCLLDLLMVLPSYPEFKIHIKQTKILKTLKINLAKKMLMLNVLFWKGSVEDLITNSRNKEGYPPSNWPD